MVMQDIYFALNERGNVDKSPPRRWVDTPETAARFAAIMYGGADPLRLASPDTWADPTYVVPDTQTPKFLGGTAPDLVAPLPVVAAAPPPAALPAPQPVAAVAAPPDPVAAFDPVVSGFAVRIDDHRTQRPAADRPLRVIVKAIRNGKWADKVAAAQRHPYGSDAYKEAKADLPYFTPHGTFAERKDTGLVAHSGVICLDFDLQDNPAARNEPRKVFERIPYTLAVFASPSGKGFKILVRCSAAAANHKAAADQVRVHYEAVTAYNLDPSQGRLSQPCFVSYDPAAVWNGEAQDFPFRKPKPPAPQSRPPVPRTLANSPADPYARAEAMLASRGGFGFAPGNRHNYRFHLACLLAELGVAQADAQAYIEAHYAPADGRPCNAVKSAYRKAQTLKLVS